MKHFSLLKTISHQWISSNKRIFLNQCLWTEKKFAFLFLDNNNIIRQGFYSKVGRCSKYFNSCNYFWRIHTLWVWNTIKANMESICSSYPLMNWIFSFKTVTSSLVSVYRLCSQNLVCFSRFSFCPTSTLRVNTSYTYKLMLTKCKTMKTAGGKPLSF